VNFTRDPVIETVITPKEGCKLVVRNSKGTGGEDYFVDAVEVVSFGNFLFFRSLERPKSFLLPVSDYEILELKETRMVLKTTATDKSIKISSAKKEMNSSEEQEKNIEKKKRRYRRRKMTSEQKKKAERQEISKEHSLTEEGKTSTFTRLFPPPSTLIKENLGKAKAKEEENIFVKDIEEPSFAEERKEETFPQESYPSPESKQPIQNLEEVKVSEEETPPSEDS